MKKLYFLVIFLFAFIGKNIAQNTGLTTYSCTITSLNTTGFTSFVIDNSGTKWMGFNSAIGGVHPSSQLLRYNGTAWDSFPHVPSKKVNALAVDIANNVWIGTDTGLVMFNGSVFTTYCMANSTIASNKVISVACAGGKIYAGTYSGLCVFNGSTFTNYNHASAGLSHDTIYSITYESASAIWLGNIGGLEKFNGTTFSYFGTLGGVGTDKVNCIYIDGSNNKWLGTNNHGVVKYDNTNFFTMQQLYGIVPIQTGCIAYLHWPRFTNCITKGESGGVCFFGGNPSGSASNGIGLIEVAGSSVYTYSNLSTNYVPQSTFLAYDNTSNYLFAAKRYSISHPFDLLKFDKNVYSDPSNSNIEFLDINEVQEQFLGNSDFAWNLTNPRYSVPKGQYKSPLFAASMWMGGYSGGQLHMAAMTYRQNGLDFFPGPLDTLSDSTLYVTGNVLNPNTSSAHPVWKINRYDIANFIYNWSIGTVQSGAYVPPANFLSWPGNGTGNYAHNLAPYVDINGNGIYDPINDGDYPLIKGDQMIWWMYNDNAAYHGETHGNAFGVEVHASAYAFVCPNIADSNRVLNYTTFYNYKIFNRSHNKYDSTILGLWIDADLGNFTDDYIGCNVTDNYGFIYNGDPFDDNLVGLNGYGSNLPLFACNILKGPRADIGDNRDNNNNGIKDEANEMCLMNHFSYFNNTADPQLGNPMSVAIQYYNFLNSHWKNGTEVTYGGNGTSPLNPATKFLYPGNTDPYGIGLGGTVSAPITAPVSNWTQYTAGVTEYDMRYIMGVGPFTMQPSGVYDLDYALVFTQDSSHCYADTLPDCLFPRAKQDNNRVRDWFNNSTFPSCLSMVGVGIKENVAPQLDVNVFPNPANNYLHIEFKEAQQKVTIEMIDMLGKIVKAGVFSDVQKYISVPVEDLGRGVYSVKIKTGDNYGVKKFVKE
jgi:hypothetical protein